MVAQLPMNSILLRSRTAILATARICHNHTPSVTLLSSSSSSSSSSPARSYYSSSPEQQSLQQSQLNPSHVQLSPGMTFASLQQQNHVWMSPVRTLIYIYLISYVRKICTMSYKAYMNLLPFSICTYVLIIGG